LVRGFIARDADLPQAKPTAFTRLARRVIGQPFYGWFSRAKFAVGRFNGLAWSTM